MTSHLVLTLVFGSLVLGWLGLGAYTVAGRAAHDLRVRRLAAARTTLTGRALSRRTLRLAAGDPALPAELAHALAFEAAALVGLDRLRQRAATHRTELGKWRRLEALRILSIVDERSALPLLEDALRADADLATAAGAILNAMGSVPAARVLADAVGESSVPASRVAAYLDEHPADIAAVILELAADPAPARRYWGVSLLARHGERADARERLCASASDADANVRAATAEALGALATHGLDELRALAADDSWFVRAHAARALGARGAPVLAAAVGPLLADESWWVRSSAKDALVSLGAGAEAVVAAYLDHADAFARNGAAEVLERVGAVDAAFSAAALAPHDPGKRRYARAIIAASEAAYIAAYERAAPELRPRLAELAAGVAANLKEAA